MKKSKVIKIVVMLSVMVIGFSVFLFWYNDYNKPENHAIRVTDAYLEAQVNGSDTSDYKSFLVNDFINLLDYKFLNVVSVEEKFDTTEFDYDHYIDFYSDRFDTFKEFREYIANLYGDNVISNNARGVSVEPDGPYYEITLLYNIEAANKLGNVLNKRYYYVLDNYKGKYLIVDSKEE